MPDPRPLLRWAVFTPLLLLPVARPLSAPAGPKGTGEFELRVGGRTYEVIPGRPVSLTTPRGERVEVVLIRKEVLRFQQYGVTFNHSRELKVTAERQGQVTTITAEATESPLALIHLFPASIGPAEARKLLVDELDKEFRSRGGRVSAAPGAVTRQMAGATRSGTLLDVSLAQQKLKTEVYAFARGGGTTAVVLQHDLEDAALARRYFPTLVESLR